MNKSLYAALIALSLFIFVLPATAGSLADGLKEYNRSHYAAALKIWQPLAEQGDPAAQYWVGELYYQGALGAKDYGKALAWAKRSADQGNGLALRRLGVMYESGYGLAKDSARAVGYYRDAAKKIARAAELGDDWSQLWFGMMYKYGDGVEKDLSAAARWFRKAAEQGNRIARNELGASYADGSGVARDDVEAVRWFRSSARQGYALAQTNLGYMCLNGLGTARDETEAMKWYRLAAEQGVDPSRVNDREQQISLAMYTTIADRNGGRAKDKARLLLEDANDRWPDHVGLLLARIELEMSETRFDDAIEFSGKLARMHPDNESFQVRLLDALSHAHKDRDAALALYQKLAASSGVRGKEFYAAARAFLEQAGKSDELARLWERFARDYPDCVEVRAHQAETMAANNDFAGALRLYRKLLDDESPTVARLAKYADIIRKQSGAAAAAAELDAVARQFPGQFFPQFLASATPSLPLSVPAPPADAVPRLVAQVGHQGGINALDLSADGLMITAGSDGAAILWSVEAGKELRRFVHSRPVRTARFLPDRSTVVTGSDDGIVRSWQLSTGKLMREVPAPAGSVWALEASADGSLLLSGGGTNTLHVWETASGKLRDRLDGHSASINAIAFSPDNRYAATASTDMSIIVWDLSRKSRVETLHGHTDSVTALSFSANGRSLLSCSMDGTVRLWHLATGVEISRYHLSGKALSLAPVGGSGIRAVVGTSDGAALLVDLEKPAQLRTFASSSAEVRALAAKDGVLYVAGDRGVVDAFALDSGRSMMSYAGTVMGGAPYLFSPQGHRFLTGSSDHGLWEWQADSGNVRHYAGTGQSRTWGAYRRDNTLQVTAQLPPGAVIEGFADRFAVLGEGGGELLTAAGGARVSFPLRMVGWGQPLTPAGNNFWLAGGENGKGYLVNGATGVKERPLIGHHGPIVSTAVSSDGRLGATGSFDKTVIVWDLASGAAVRTLSGFDGAVVALGFVPGKHLLAAGGPRQPVRLWDVDTGSELPSLGSNSADSESLAISPDGGYLLTAGSLYGTRLWALPAGREVRPGKVLTRFMANARDASFSADGKYLLLPGDGAGAMLLETASGKELAQLISFVDGTWAVVDTDGHYDASNGGKVDGLHWVVGTTPIELSQLKERYYEPGFLARLMGYNAEPLRKVEPFTAVALFPAVSIAPPADGSTVATIALENRGGGIGKVRVLVNGKEIAADARGAQPNPDTPSALLKVEIPEQLLVAGRENTIQVLAWNKENYLSSRGAPVRFSPPRAMKTAPITLHAIVVGVSRYAESRMNLAFSGKDAADIARALSISGKRLFGAEKVDLQLLTDETGVPNAVAPTRDNIAKAFAALANIRSTDILVVYLSGHGVMSGSAGDAEYYYLTPEARSFDLSDPAVGRRYGIASSELTEWVKRIPALKQVMVLDTCAAGGAAAKLVARRGLASDQIRSLERLKDRTGFHVLMGAAADKQSLEASPYGQGLLTYALLQGIKGAALREEQFVDVQKLFQHAADEVPRLAGSLGGIQRPLIASPVGASFDIGQLTSEDKSSIPLAKVKPMILKAAFQDDLDMADTLLLGRLVNTRLREEAVALRGNAQLVYVDSDELPGAWTITGRYQSEGDKVTVKILLREGKNRKFFTMEGKGDDLPGLAKSLVARAAAEISALAVEKAGEKP